MGEDEDGPSRALVALLQPLCSDAWVQCDHCELWRRVPKEVSERLGDDEQWYAPPSLPEHISSFPPTQSDVFAPSDARPAGGPRRPASSFPLDPSFPARIAAIEAPRRFLAAREPPRVPDRRHDRAPTRAISCRLYYAAPFFLSSLPTSDHALTHSDSLVPLRPLRAGSAS